tara:strand:- start:1122 stop:1979 length:858 start_codon:yes stop_codon:yes gene_type:complete
MEPIKLSILIPTYNFKIGLNKILDCIESIEEDLHDSIEIIISDDSDKEIISRKRNDSLKKSFKNYIYKHNFENLGAVDNWNKLISIAKGDYLWLLHHDEFWDKEKDFMSYIFKVIKFEKPNIIILPITKSKTKRFDYFNINISNRHITFDKILRLFINSPKFLIKTNIIGPPSSLIYKQNKLNYDKSLKYLVDVEFYIRLFKYFNSKSVFIGSQQYNLISSQNNQNSITRIIRKEIKTLKNKERIFICRRHKLNFNIYEKVLSIYTFLILKINLLITTKINVEKL